MKKIAVALFTLALAVSVYVDLTSGTLPSSTISNAEEITIESAEPTLPHYNAAVKPGQTLITIIEQKQGGSPDVPISQLVDDFQKLNPGVSHERLQIGETYKFPSYSN
jgi:hypothetical protein